MLGMMQHYHHAEFTPQFCKQYATVGYEIQNGLAEYKKDVEQGRFPDASFSPYKIPDEERDIFLEMMEHHKKSTQDPDSVDNDEPAIKVY